MGRTAAGLVDIPRSVALHFHVHVNTSDPAIAGIVTSGSGQGNQNSEVWGRSPSPVMLHASLPIPTIADSDLQVQALGAGQTPIGPWPSQARQS